MVSFSKRRESDASVVLIIEGDVELGAAIKAFLDDHGFVALVERDRRGALRALEMLRPHVVLFDQHAPGVSVADFAREVRTCCDSGAMSRLLMTCTSGGAEDAVHVDAVLPKPFDTDRLIALLHAHAGAVRHTRSPALSLVQS